MSTNKDFLDAKERALNLLETAKSKNKVELRKYAKTILICLDCYMDQELTWKTRTIRPLEIGSQLND